ncbi:Hcp family type VI secretion system effector [Chitinophagaceae bacterium MMS25-I14]
MSSNAFLTLKGAKQGIIKGGVIQKGRENQILVHAVHHDIVSPRDPASGLPTGKRMHKPFIITKEIDQSTPLLYNALVNNENITEFTLNFWGTDRTGLEKITYKIQLTNASISEITLDMVNNLSDSGIKMPVLEQVCFTYQKITWTWMEGGITSSDDWSAPVV